MRGTVGPTHRLLGSAIALAVAGMAVRQQLDRALQVTALVVENGSSQTILVVNFGSCSDPTWGPDRLGATETIAAGAERSWIVAAGCHDVCARCANGSQTWFDIDVAAGKTTRVEATSLSASAAAEPSSVDRKAFR